MMIDPKPYAEFVQKLKKAQAAARAKSKSELNVITDRHLARCVDNTATGTSPDSPTLSISWDRSGVTETPSGEQAEVFNPIDYSSYYEFGHR